MGYIKSFNAPPKTNYSNSDVPTISLEGFIIDYHDGVLIKDDKTKSYTFELIPRNSNSTLTRLFNIVFVAKRGENSYWHSIIAYNLTPQQKEALKNGEKMPGKLDYTFLSKNELKRLVTSSTPVGMAPPILPPDEGSSGGGGTGGGGMGGMMNPVTITVPPPFYFIPRPDPGIPMPSNPGNTTPIHGGGGGSPGGGDDDEDKGEKADWIIVDKELREEYPCFYETLLDVIYTPSELNSTLLQAFGYWEGDFDLIYKFDKLKAEDISITNTNINAKSAPYDIFITFNKSRIHTFTKIGIAIAAIHENMHAILDYLWVSGSLTSQSENPTYAELTKAFVEAVTKRNRKSLEGLKKRQHKYMAHHIQLLGQTLHNYVSDKLGKNLSLSYCTKLMWGGLAGGIPNYFNNQFKQLDERRTIKRMFKAEIENKSYTFTLNDGTQKTIQPKSNSIPTDCGQ